MNFIFIIFGGWIYFYWKIWIGGNSSWYVVYWCWKKWIIFVGDWRCIVFISDGIIIEN